MRGPDEVTSIEDTPVIVIGHHGTADLSDLRWALHDAVLAGGRRIVVDVSAAPVLSSSTVAVLLSAHRRCRARGGGVVLEGCTPGTLDLLHRNGLHRIFRVEASGGPAARGRRRTKTSANPRRPSSAGQCVDEDDATPSRRRRTVRRASR